MELLSVVVNYKTPVLLENFLESYRTFVDQQDRFLTVIDVEGDPDRPNKMNGYPWDIWHTTTDNIGYARSCNYAVSVSPDTEIIGIFNSDTRFVDSNCVDSCIDLLQSNDDVAVVGPLQYNSAKKITHAGIFGTLKEPKHRAWMQDSRKEPVRDILDAVTVAGSAYFIKKSVWDQLTNCPLYQDMAAGAEGAFLPTQHFYEETYCSYHAQAHGYRVLYNGGAEMVHEWHKSSEVGGSYATDAMKSSQEFFRIACDHHGIEYG